VGSQNFVHSCATASLVRYVKFCVIISVLTSDFLVHCFLWITLKFLIDFKVSECDARGSIPKLANQKILQMDAMAELGRTAEEKSSVHIQQIQYLEK